jgi:hypothetical protein
MRPLLSIGLLLVTALVARAETRALSPKEIAALIDKRVAEKWDAIEPAPLADDATVLRRASLDLIGRIPRVSELRELFDDTAADRRERALERLFEHPLYPIHLGAVYRRQLLPANGQPFLFANPQFKSWLEQQFRDNVPYDKTVRDLLTAPTGFNQSMRGAGNNNVSPASAFFQANEFKPENVVSNVSRVFLGVRLECAQCHDHPFARWTRRQFWETASFFASIQRNVPRFNENGRQRPAVEIVDRQMQIPGTDKVVRARFLDKVRPEWKDDDDTRAVFAEWVTSPKNPFFARAAVSRLWHHFFGHGLIEPLDEEPTDESPPSHPELLQELADQLIAHEFDLKVIMRGMVLSQTYQRSSKQTHPSQDDPRRYARRTVRGLFPEQMFDSLVVATGFREEVGQQRLGFGGGGARFDFLNRFANTDLPSEKQTSILQALSLMNGKLTADATHLKRSQTLAAIVDAPFLSTFDKVETLFLATLSRRPSADELDRFVGHVRAGGVRQDEASALADVFWVLLNSTEFGVNR